MKKEELRQAIEKNLDSALEMLTKLISYSSIRGSEKEICLFLKDRVERYADSAELVPLPERLMDDPDYSFRLAGFSYNGTANLRLRLIGTGGGKSLAFNTHLDVVPPAPCQENAYSARIIDDKIYGRGACDAKGQIATLWLVLKSLHDLGLKPAGDITLDFVVEEECGGNGTLLVARKGLKADGALILEPTDLQVAHLVRGAVWFEVLAKGKAGHTGSPGSTASALKEEIKVMEAIEKVREELLEISRKSIEKIAFHPNPMPCNFGMLHAGNWPATTPREARLRGVFGFLPPFKRKEVQERLRQAVSPFQAEIKFNMLNNEPSFIAESHPLVQTLIQATAEAGVKSHPEFMNASCDAWRYSEQLQIPAVVFGGGSIATAHSDEEYIPLEDIKKAATILIHFIDKWSGLRHAK